MELRSLPAAARPAQRSKGGRSETVLRRPETALGSGNPTLAHPVRGGGRPDSHALPNDFGRHVILVGTLLPGLSGGNTLPIGTGGIH
jgi:hypothetical protein